MQLHFQYCSPNEKNKVKKLNKQIWKMIHKAQMSSNEFQLNKYKHKVLTRVNDTTHVYANKGRLRYLHDVSTKHACEQPKQERVK